VLPRKNRGLVPIHSAPVKSIPSLAAGELSGLTASDLKPRELASERGPIQGFTEMSWRESQNRRRKKLALGGCADVASTFHLESMSQQHDSEEHPYFIGQSQRGRRRFWARAKATLANNHLPGFCTPCLDARSNATLIALDKGTFILTAEQASRPRQLVATKSRLGPVRDAKPGTWSVG
jgi:hypothetical protein